MNSKLKILLTAILAVVFSLSAEITNAQMYWNQACIFSGNSSSYVSVPNSTSLDLQSNFTIETWINPTSLTGISKGILAKGGTLGSSLRYGIRLNSNGRIALITNGAQRLISKTSSVVTSNNWTHVTVSYNVLLSEFKIYFNGILDTSSVIAGAAPLSNSDSLFIGISGNTTPYAGKLDEVRIWRRTLTDTEVSNYYRSTIGASTGTYANLIMSLTFQKEEATGDRFSLKDWSENSNDANGRNINPFSFINSLYPTIMHNEAIELDGNGDYLESVEPFTFTNPVTNYFTMQCWVYPRSQSQSTLIIAPIENFGNDFSLYINSSGKIEATVESELFLSGSGGTLPLNRWTHVAFVMNEQLGKFYFNGKHINTDTAGFANLELDDDKLYIGGGPGAISDFNGFIDEVRITETSLKQPQLLNEVYMSLDKNFRVSPGYAEFVYNFDGLLLDNMKDGGPRLEVRGNARFSHPGGIPNQPVSPTTRRDASNFGKSFYTKSSSKRIPASGGAGNVVDSFSINKSLQINDVNFFIALNHTNLSDLEIVLTGPEGDSVIIMSGYSNIGENDNLAAVFDDNSGNGFPGSGINTSLTPVLKAQSVLNTVFAGSNSHGYWKLRIRDNSASDTGRLYAWGIQINNMTEREKNLNLSALIQGFYNESSNSMIEDSLTVYLTIPIVNLTDSSTAILNNQGEGLFSFKTNIYGEDFPYLIRIRHRNSIETWANFIPSDLSSLLSFNGYEASYDFRTDDSKAFGDNMVPVDLTPLRYAIYSGDQNQDGFVNLTDVVNVLNDANVFLTGYVSSDMNGDNSADLSDVVFTLNNANLFVSAVTP